MLETGVIQKTIPLARFSQVMRERDHGFADRVRVFEDRFGRVDRDTLAVLAQGYPVCGRSAREK